MVIQDARKLNKFKQLIDRLKAHPDNIEHTESPIKNEDVLRLLEISKKMSKSEAIQFAVEFTIENFGLKAISLSPTEEKLEKLRYAQKEAHEASEDLGDNDSDDIRDKTYG